MEIQSRIATLNWDKAITDLNDNGYALVPKVLTAAECDELVRQYTDETLFRKTVIMERHQYGKGEYKYYKYPLLPVIQQLRENVYPKLAPVANGWMEALNKDIHFPDTLVKLLEYCHANEQLKPTALILQYATGGKW
jgi:hypothetical protein